MKHEKRNQYYSKIIGYCDWYTILGSLAACFAIIFWLIFRSGYGIDFTDEGFYLNSIAFPWQYDGTNTQFGFIFEPLYRIFNGNIVFLRQFNVLLTYFLSFFMAFVFFHSIENMKMQQVRYSLLIKLIISGVISCGSCALFSSSLNVTPNYNTLSMQSVVITAIGLLGARKTFSFYSVFFWLLIGIGGWLAFMAKPTTAIGLSLVSAIYLLLASKINFRLFFISIITALFCLILSAYYIDGSISTFIFRYEVGLQSAEYLGSGIDRIFRFDKLNIVKKELIPICLVAFYVLSTTMLFYFRKNSYVLIGYFALAITNICIFLMSFEVIRINQPINLYEPVVMLGFPLGMSIAAFLLWVYQTVRGQLKLLPWTRSDVAVVICFMLLPHVVALGTNRNYWLNAPWAAIFWIIAGLALLLPVLKSIFTDWRELIAVGICGQLIVAILISGRMVIPSRQDSPLVYDTTEVGVGSNKSPLFVSENFGSYISDTRKNLENNGFKSLTPVLDMTGQSPGFLYAIGALPIVSGWMIGGYRGSDELALYKLKESDCKGINDAWILVEPDGPRSLSYDVLSKVGIDIERDYVKVHDVLTPSGAGGYQERRVQSFYKPIHPIVCVDKSL